MNDASGSGSQVSPVVGSQQSPFPPSRGQSGDTSSFGGGGRGIRGRSHQGEQSGIQVGDSGTGPRLGSGSRLVSMFGSNPSAPTMGDGIKGSGGGPSVPSGPGGSRELLRKDDFIAFGQVQMNPKNPKQVTLRLLFYNTGGTRLNEFKVDYQVRPGWQLNVQPADGNALEVGGSPPLTQVLYLFNQANAPFSLHVRATYLFGAQPCRETGTITSLT
jgi:hypothetical protein